MALAFLVNIPFQKVFFPKNCEIWSLVVIPWEMTKNRETHGRTVRVGRSGHSRRKPMDRTGMKQCCWYLANSWFEKICCVMALLSLVRIHKLKLQLGFILGIKFSLLLTRNLWKTVLNKEKVSCRGSTCKSVFERWNSFLTWHEFM